jgi:hypothetical protein
MTAAAALLGLPKSVIRNTPEIRGLPQLPTSKNRALSPTEVQHLYKLGTALVKTK